MSTLQPTLNAASAANLPAPLAAPATPAVSAKTWIAVIGATLGAFMAVLNIQIVNASLADIQGAIGAGIDDGGWISTSYLIAEIVVIPLSGWLAQVFSIRIYLLTNAILFLVLSAACALAQDLPQMIVLRAVQGFTGGVLIPMAFTLIITLLPRAKQPVGLALFALSATFAPAIGPTIGGYLTENFGWQYIFYVNVIPGAIMVGMLWYALDAKPMKLSLLAEGDWAGIITMAIGLSALQTVLEEGNKDDWFGSPFIVKLSVIAAVALTAFLIIELTVKKPLLNLRLLVRRNFGFGMLANFLLGVALYGSVFILPQYLSRIQGYNSEQIGMVLAWTGLPQLAADPAGAAPDAEIRRADHHRHRLRAVRGLELHEHLHDERLWLGPVAVAQHRPRDRPGAGAGAAVGGGNRRHRGGECGLGLRPVQHDAQSRRRRRHRAAPDRADQARAVSLQRADAVGLGVRAGHPHAAGAAHAVLHQSRRARPGRCRASRLCRDRSCRAEAGLHLRLQRHLLSARHGADRGPDRRPSS